jgi:hypothetical protein
MWKRCPKAIARQIAIFEPLREFPDVHLAYAKDPRQLAAGPFAVEVVAPFQGHMSDQLGFRFAAPRARLAPTSLRLREVSPRCLRGRHDLGILAELSDFPYRI